jgi:hypothetical protein
MQGKSAGQAGREELPYVPSPIAAIRETLTGYETESLTAHHLLCHPETIEHYRSDRR